MNERSSSSGGSLIQSVATLARAGKRGEAIEKLLQFLELEPSSFDALSWLSVLYRVKGQLAESLIYAQRATELRPFDAGAQSNLGLTLVESGELDLAGAAFERAIQLAPAVPMNYEQLSKVRQAQSREGEALAASRQAFRLAPNSFDTLLSLARLSFNQNRGGEAIEYAQRALSQNPQHVDARLLLAAAQIDQGLAAEAESHLNQILKLDRANGSAYALVGTQLQAMGMLAAADEAFRRSIELQPEQGLSYCALLRNSKVTPKEEPMLASLEDLLGAGKLNLRGQSFVHYGLGKAYDDLGQYREAMEQFDAANRISYHLKFGDQKWDRRHLSGYVDWTIATFTKKFIADNLSAGNESDLPLFVVGMMRSGTTLVEQILSSHSMVEGAGEQSFWLAHFQEAIAPGQSRLNREALERLSKGYLAKLKSLFPESPHVTDKMPGNYRVLGLLAIAFPNAKFMRTKRNPIDTALSIYMTPNRVANDFANDRANIVFAYRQYERLAEHWEQVIDSDRLCSVSYENLVANPKPVTQDLVGFTGLPWEEACLHPEANERNVITPSVWQVRQPVYTSSVERWKRYEPWLREFAELA